MSLVLYIAYQESWIRLSTPECWKKSCCRTLKSKTPLKRVFQQDNDPKHTCMRAKSRFQTNRIQVIQWPARSPDRTSIDNLWADIKDAVHEAKPRNAKELLSWAAIPVDRCQKLVDSM
uniref:Tc1-like transposase DDE domain-containing protein n=1 Tax=Fundulus heteroclitus TaxID=8078 RepID=A0A3Q2UGW1_FUNHE